MFSRSLRALEITGVVVFLIAFAVSITFLPVAFLLGLLVLVLIGLLATREHDYFFYAMVALIPCVGIIFSLAVIPGVHIIPLVGNWDAPVADFLALPLLAVYGIKILREDRVVKLHHHIKDHLPGIGWYAPFLIVAGLTIFRAPPEMISQSVHYYVRFVLFSYLAYVALPFWVITSKAALQMTIRIIAWSGIVVALFGLSSLLVNAPFWGVWRRVSPYAIGVFAPLLTNHNLLAEVLIFTIPFVWLTAREHFGVSHKWYLVAFWMVGITTLLTFSRAAWIALLVEMVLAYRLVRPHELLKRAFSMWPLLVCGAGLFGYMILFSGSTLVQSSTATRLDLTRIALQQAAITPWFGKGIGTFLPTIGVTYSFIQDYGDPIEAHGLIQKLLFETGIVGLGLFLMFFAWFFVILVKRWHQLPEGQYRDMVLAVFLAVAGAFVYQIFNTSYFSPKLWFPVGMALVILYGKWKFSQ